MENTLRDLPSQGRNEDHLHIRGEYQDGTCKVGALIGSPPHTWRILAMEPRRLGSPRITSTYVENTKSTRPQNNFYKDHLHIRGEYYTLNQLRG